jgi:hypothetical protein
MTVDSVVGRWETGPLDATTGDRFPILNLWMISTLQL